jgi:hypothetical protein
MRCVKPFIAIAAALTFAPAAHAAGIVDGSFETQGSASGLGLGISRFCYFPACATGAWSGGAGGGLRDEEDGAFGGPPTADGSYTAFLQNLGFISQTFSIAQAGAYLFGWTDAGRPQMPTLGGNQSYLVTLADLANATTYTLYSGSTTSGQPFTARSSGSISLAAGTYTLSFNGLTSAGDETAFIDAVTLTNAAAAVPEPATWAMMILGFGLIGAAMRTRERRFAFG